MENASSKTGASQSRDQQTSVVQDSEQPDSQHSQSERVEVPSKQIKTALMAMFDDPTNKFTPWFKLIVRDFLAGWWDELLVRKGEDGLVDAQSLEGFADGSKVHKMV